MIRPFLFAALSAYSVALAAAGPEFSAEDVFALEYAGDVRISPDGERIVYERQANDIMSDTTRSNLWLVNTGSGAERPLVSGTVQASSPRWSPDGGRIAWLEAAESGTGIHVRWLDSGQDALLATVTESPSSLTWSPDGRMLAFVMPVKAASKPLVEPRKPPDGAQWAEPVKTIDAVIYRRDGSGFLEPAHSQIFVLPADGGTPRQVTAGAFNSDGELSWSPDGEHILFAANRHDDWEYEPVERDLWSVSIVDGSLSQLTDSAGGEFAPAPSPGGRHIAYLFDDDRRIPYRNVVLHVMSADGTDDRSLTAALDRSIERFQWSGNGRSLYLQYDDRGMRKLARVTLDGELEVLANDVGGTSPGRPYTSGTFSVARDGTVAYTRGTAYRPADVAVLDRRGARVLTGLNEDLLAHRELGQVHEITYPSSFDGTGIQGWYVTP
ncbi:MAG TPA: DPP IV N-terminal domain-containing protein, partial [Woeseiaceae bacterium]|nr:DPP IV N-terminal domain-containing protein [Woeseiaceae bacterium]